MYRVLPFWGLAACVVAATHVAVASGLQLTDLGPTPSYVPIQAAAINDEGEVAGVTESSGAPVPFVWQNGVMTDLPNLPGATHVHVTGINSSGQVVGFSDAADGHTHAVTWQGGAISELPLEPGSTTGFAYDINDTGQIVGAMGDSLGTAHSVLWSGGSITDLDLTSGTTAFSINGSGAVSGGVVLIGGARQVVGFLWQNGTLTDLSSQLVVAGTAINDQGLMAGYNIVPAGSFPYHAIIYQNGVLTDLGAAPGSSDGLATAINDMGQVIGVGDVNGAYPFLWQNGQMTGLQSLLPAGSPWLLRSVWDINDHGQIIGAAINRDTLTYELVLFTIPEPSTVTLAAFGLAAFAACGWRRRKK